MCSRPGRCDKGHELQNCTHQKMITKYKTKMSAPISHNLILIEIELLHSRRAPSKKRQRRIKESYNPCRSSEVPTNDRGFSRAEN